MTIPPTEDGEASDEVRQPPSSPAPRPVLVMTTSAAQPERRHVATDEELDDERRQVALRAHFARKPVVTWTLIGVISAMFAGQQLLGGTEDPYVMIRLGGQVPDEILAGAWWRLVSSAFLHAGFMHFALNTYVLYVVGNTLERILGSARFLVAYTLSVLCASLTALVFSDARLTVGASGGVFGLFGVEAIVVFLRPELLPAQIRQTHSRNVIINLLINVANSFRPNIAMAAHFGGGLAGAIVGLFLVPHRLEATPRTPAWANVAAALSALVLAAGVGLGVHHALGGAASRPPTLTRLPIVGLEGVTATAEVPSNLPLEADTPGTFGNLQHEPAAVSFQWAVVDAEGRRAMEQEVSSGTVPDGMTFGGSSTASLEGRDAIVATYVAVEAPLTLERVIVFTEPSAEQTQEVWIVELAYWTAAGDAYQGLGREIAASIERAP